MKIIDIARACHDINAAYCRSQGDNSQPSWWNAPEWQKESAIAGVKLHLANPLASPADSHAAWMAMKLADGWKVGPVKNPDTKEHPLLVPYEELAKEHQAKDFIFKQVVATMADHLEPEAS